MAAEPPSCPLERRPSAICWSCPGHRSLRRCLYGHPTYLSTSEASHQVFHRLIRGRVHSGFPAAMSTAATSLLKLHGLVRGNRHTCPHLTPLVPIPASARLRIGYSHGVQWHLPWHQMTPLTPQSTSAFSLLHLTSVTSLSAMVLALAVGATAVYHTLACQPTGRPLA